MGDNTEFQDAFNWWYLFGILGVLVAFPLLHVMAGWYVYFFSH